MVKIIVKLNEKILKEHEVTNALTIGRETSDLLLKNPAVSGTHARLDIEKNRYILKDLKSTNGTFVNKGRISTQELHHGDVINIGKFELEFINREETELLSGAASFGDGSDGMTVMINTEDIIHPRPQKEKDTEKAEENRRQAQAGKLVLLPKSRNFSRSVVMYKLKKETMLLGSGENVDIRIKGLTIANVAAAIRRADDGYYIQFMGGISRLRVNGRKPDGDVKLKSKDKIEIGSYRFEFLE